jgi:citrate lyase subunit beta/citryl-CoA lyase
VRLRSLLFVPGDRPDRMQKALQAGADAVILDLEDAVAIERKPEAREHVAAFLAVAPRRVRVLVRINALQSAFLAQDLACVAQGSPDAIVLPKAEGALAVLELQERMRQFDLASPILPIATETPSAIFRLGEYATVSGLLAGLTWGAEDLPAAIGAVSAREPDGRFTPPYEMLRSLTLFAAHAAAVAAIETVYPEFRDLNGLTEYVRRASRDGFTGMMAIHPAQVPIINAGFTPAAAQLERARRIVAAFAAQPGVGVVALDGAMLDAPHLRQAQHLLARAGDEDRQSGSGGSK